MAALAGIYDSSFISPTPYFFMKWLPLEAAIPLKPEAEFQKAQVMGGAAGKILFARRREEQGFHEAVMKS